MIISRITFFLKVVGEKGPPKSLMRWENIGVNVKKNLWKVFPQPQKPGQACRKALGCTKRPKQTTRGNIPCVGALQILVRQGSFCLKRLQTRAHASGSPRAHTHFDRGVKSLHVQKTQLFSARASKLIRFFHRSVRTPFSACCNGGVVALKLPLLIYSFRTNMNIVSFD